MKTSRLSTFPVFIITVLSFYSSIAAAMTDPPISGGMACNQSGAPKCAPCPPCISCPCPACPPCNLGGSPPAAPPAAPNIAGSGIQKSPAEPVNANSTKQVGGDGVTISSPHGSLAQNMPAPKTSNFAGVDLVSGIPSLNRTDCDYRSNGMFGLTINRTYLHIANNYTSNSLGETMLGPGWMLNWDVRLEIQDDNFGATPALRASNGELIPMRSTYSGGPSGTIFRGNPDVMSATLEWQNNDNYDVWRYTTDSGDTQLSFDIYGRLRHQWDRNGNEIVLDYDSLAADAKLLTVSTGLPDARYLSFEYYGSGHLKKVIPSWATDRYTEYEYTDNSAGGQLATVKDGSGRIIEHYLYNVDPGWPEWDVSYFNSFIIQQPNAAGTMETLVTYVYESPGIDGHYGLIAMLDGAGTKMLWQDSGVWRQPNGLGVNIHADSMAEHAFAPPTIDWYDFNVSSSPILRDEQDLGSSAFTGAYNGTRRPRVIKRGGEEVTTYTYCTNDFWSNFANYDYNHLYKIELPLQPPEYRYYDSMGRIIGTSKADQFTSTTYDSYGNTHTVTVNGSYTTTYNVDSYGRLQSVQDPVGTTSYVHNSQGHVIQITDKEGRVTNVTYDSRGRRTAVGSLGTTTTYAYDWFDRLTTTTDHIGNNTVYAYDSRDRLTTATDPMGNKTVYEYSPTTGTLTSVTNALGKKISYVYDIFGQVIKITDERGKNTTYTYDAFGRLKTETNPLSKTTEYTYKNTGGPSCGCGSSAGGIGQVASIKDPLNNYTYFDYDSADRLTTTTFSSLSTSLVNTYDSNGRITQRKDTRLSSTDFPSQTFSYSYDSFGRLDTVTYPDSSTVSYAYDAAGRLSTMTDPDSNVTTYNYATDSDNKRLSSIDHTLLGTTTYSYNTNGLLEYEIYPTNAQNYWGRDSLNRVDAIIHVDSSLNAMQGDSYTYNANSMRTAISYYSDIGPFADADRTFTYDNVLRLTREQLDEHIENKEYFREYTYDDAGNRTQMDVTDKLLNGTITYTYNDFNQLTQSTDADGNTTYGYDDNGNQSTRVEPTGANPRHYTGHDRFNHLIEAGTYSTGFPPTLTPAVSYAYDASGRLLMRTWPSGDKEKYYYNGINLLLVKAKPNGGDWNTKKVNWLKQASIGQILANREYRTSSIDYEDRYYHYDLLGNLEALSDEYGMATDYFDMESFGNVQSSSQSGIHMTTKEWDADAGLYYFNARWLNCFVGNWLEPEPTQKDGPNLYAYVFNSPTILIDQNGLQATNPRGTDPDMDDPSTYEPKLPAKLKDLIERLKSGGKPKPPGGGGGASSGGSTGAGCGCCGNTTAVGYSACCNCIDASHATPSKSCCRTQCTNLCNPATKPIPIGSGDMNCYLLCNRDCPFR